jgi:hypothetical protein
MNIYKLKVMNWILISILLTASTISYAANSSTIEFFSSNNTHEIDVAKAYARLMGKAQHDLKNNTITVLQNNHIEQGKFENILGMYQMTSDKNMTGDNTEIFYASPLQNFSDSQIFSLAAQLANTLNQESVAVFIPSNQQAIADITVKFTSQKPSITEAINMIREKLPTYATAFSLHLSSECQGFNNTKVSEIEWLGSRININEIKKAFPGENISSHQGQAYLVYKNGQTQRL